MSLKGCFVSRSFIPALKALLHGPALGAGASQLEIRGLGDFGDLVLPVFICVFISLPIFLLKNKPRETPKTT